MSDQSDSQNRSEEQVQLSEGSDPSSSYDEGSRSTPSNLPKAATRTRKKRTSDSEDEDYVAVEDEATSRKKVLKKEYSTAVATKPGMKQKVPAKRIPMSKPEHLLKSLWDLNPKRLLQKGRRGRRGSKRPLLECLGDPQS